jgi:hypothetical protein
MRRVVMMGRFTLFLIIVLAGILVPVSDAHAHRPEPGSAEGITAIPDPDASYAYYRELAAPDEVHVYRVEAQTGQFFHAGINVPQIDGLEDYGVTLALLGPGLPPLTEAQLPFHGLDADEDRDQDQPGDLPLPEALLLDLRSGNSGGIVAESVVGGEFYEPFTQTRYWERQSIDLDLPASGSYYLLVWSPEGVTGKYVLDTGTEEVFDLADMLRFPKWWLDTRVYFEQESLIIGLLTLLLSGGVGLVAYRRWA